MDLSPADRGVALKQIYSDLNRKYEEEQTAQTAAKLSLPYLNLLGFPIDHNVLALIPKQQAEELQTIAFYREGRSLKLATTNPTPAVQRLADQFRQQGLTVEVYYVSPSSFAEAVKNYHQIITAQPRSQAVVLSSRDFAQPSDSLDALGRRLATASTTEIMEALLGNALSLNASDIHLEPAAGQTKIRYRLDGVLHDVTSLTKPVYQHLLSRIKLLAHLKLNLPTRSQDGSFSITYDKLAVDLRVSILPSAFGESMALRILRQDQGLLRLEELGIRGLAYERLQQQIARSNGMVLACGPTGSGKTTTLYAILSQLNEPGAKIITLEDPVEYKIPGITQTPIDENGGMTFASGLRAILRQDPDIVMIGELRDLETAEVASQAALTGHLVLSTLHTNDAAGAIPRLLSLGVKPFVLAPATNAVMAQRLVRQLCSACKTVYRPEAAWIARVRLMLAAIPEAAGVAIPRDLKFYRSRGCSACRGLGYRGRLGVYEVLVVDETIEKLIDQSASATQIKRQAVSMGMLTMAQDGILKALEGVTDLEEVFRVTEE